MSTSTTSERVRAIKFISILLVLFVVTRFAIVPNLEPWFGVMAESVKLMGIALAAAIVVETAAQKFT